MMKTFETNKKNSTSRKIKFMTYLFLAAFLSAWLFTGVFRHREYATVNLFLKYRPSFQFYFYSPIGESDNTLQSLSLKEQRSELAYIDFVEKKGGFKHILWAWKNF